MSSASSTHVLNVYQRMGTTTGSEAKPQTQTQLLNQSFCDRILRSNSKDIDEFQEAFSLFDNRGDGKIAVSQLGDVLRALGQNPTEAEVKKCCSQLKADERIAFDVFLPILQSVVRNRSSDSAEDFIEGLRHFDKDGSGYISSAELRHLLTTLGEKLTDDEVEALLVGQEDSHGNVHYEEFVKMVMSG